MNFTSSPPQPTAIRLAKAAGKHNQKVQSTTNRSQINFILNSPLLMTIRNIQHLRYLFIFQYRRKNIQDTIIYKLMKTPSITHSVMENKKETTLPVQDRQLHLQFPDFHGTLRMKRLMGRGSGWVFMTHIFFFLFFFLVVLIYFLNHTHTKVVNCWISTIFSK